MKTIYGRWLIVGLIVGTVLFAPSTPLAQADGPVVDVMQQGSSLHQISCPYGAGRQDLAFAGGSENPGCICADQPLIVPWTGCGELPPPGPPLLGCYRVKYGDTLARIAARFGTNVRCLAAANSISNPDVIYAGQCLHIPDPGCETPRAEWAPPACGCEPCRPHPTPPPAPPCSTCDPCAAATAGDYWCASFYGNHELAGQPVLKRVDAEISFNWGYSSPAPGVPPDNFSARWIRTSDMPSGTYRVKACSDDGVRVYINSVLVIDGWRVQSGATYSQDVVLRSPGVRTIVVEYFDAGGAAEISSSLERLR